MVVDIKEATPADAEAIQEIMQDAFHKYERDLGMTGHVKALQETMEDIRRDIEKKTVLVGFVDGVAVGSVRVEIMGDLAYLSRFGVRSAITKSGIGGMLIDRVEVLCREQSVRAIALHTSSRMFGLIRFYYGHGYFILHGRVPRLHPRAARARAGDARKLRPCARDEPLSAPRGTIC